MQWWEAISIPRRSLQIIDMGSVTLVPLLCEDLARLEPVSDLVRSIGASLVVALLLDGPQLGSRWTARYASVLADDPGSAVCTLTSYGMVRRCRPPGREPSRVVALWKDASGKLTEIELEDGADAVLIGTNVTVGGCITADGRRHAGSTSTLTLAAVQSLRADTQRPRPVGHERSEEPGDDGRRGLPRLDEYEVSKAVSWAEALAEAVFAGPKFVDRLMGDATAPQWRTRTRASCAVALVPADDRLAAKGTARSGDAREPARHGRSPAPIRRTGRRHHRDTAPDRHRTTTRRRGERLPAPA